MPDISVGSSQPRRRGCYEPRFSLSAAPRLASFLNGHRMSKTTHQIAGIFRVTERAVRQWIEQGCPTTSSTPSGRGVRYTLDLGGVVNWYFDRHHESLELDRARTQLASEQAKKVRMDNETRRADLAEMPMIAMVLRALQRQATKQLMALPRKLARATEGLDAAACEAMIDQAIRAELESLAAYRPRRPKL